MVPAWGTDFAKFAPTVSVAFAHAGSREAAFDSKADVVVINTDGVKWLADNLHYLRDFDHLIIDEYTCFKHASSQRSKAMLKLSRMFKHKYMMSGTPNPNSVMELWHPCLLLDDGKRLGKSYVRMRNVMQASKPRPGAPDFVEWTDKPGANQAIHAILADITIRHEFERVMKHVPPNHKHHMPFELGAKAKKAYDEMERSCLLELDNGDVSAVHAASLRTKLLQIASGAVYTGGEDGKYVVIDKSRYELVVDLIEARKHSVVFFNWRHQRDQIMEMCAERNISCALIDGSVSQENRDQIIADYQAGKYQTILLHPRTGAHGLTLTAGDTTIFVSPLYEADLMKQGIARIYRGVQDKVTNTIFIEAMGTVEHAVYERLNGKYERMADLLDLMRHHGE
jgi:SNF2 family DNA or RNA helicase